jgi:hypothetical protein
MAALSKSPIKGQGAGLVAVDPAAGKGGNPIAEKVF